MADKSLSRIEGIFNKAGRFFRGLKIKNEKLPGENFSGKDFLEGNFKGSSFPEGSFDSSVFVRSHFTRSDLSGAKLNNSIFTETDLNEAKFDESFLEKTRFLNSDLSKASFNKARMDGASIINSIGYKASFSEANLKNSAIVNSDLSYADLSGANLTGSDLSLTSLYKANLEGADLTGAHMMNTSFERVKGLTEEQRIEIKQNGGLVSPQLAKAVSGSFQGLSLVGKSLVAGGCVLLVVVAVFLVKSTGDGNDGPGPSGVPPLRQDSATVTVDRRFPALDSSIVPEELEPGLIFEYTTISRKTESPKRIEIAESLDIGITPSPGDPDSMPYIKFTGYISSPENKRYILDIGFDDHLTLFIDDAKVVDRDGTDHVNIELNLDQGYHKMNGFFLDFGGQYFFRINPGQSGLTPFHNPGELNKTAENPADN